MNKRLDFVQVARAVATLSVTYFHSHFAITNFPKDSTYNIPIIHQYGFFGVQLFFAISGFIICYISDFGKFERTDFLVKRIFRIYPLFILFCVASFLLHQIGIFNLGGLDYSIFTLIKSILLIPQPEGPIYAVGWSLEHEVIFYLIAFVALSIGGVNFLFASYIIIFALSFLLSGWDYRVFSQCQYFLAGIFFYKLWLAVGPPKNPWSAKLGITKFLVLLGNISFSLYLVHWIVFAITNRLSNYIGSPPWLTEIWRFSSIGISILLAYVLWHVIEKPFILIGNNFCNYLNKNKCKK